MIYSYLVGQGFYTFCLSIAVFFYVVGYWIRNRDRLDLKRGAVLAALGLLLYACHLFSLMMACAALGMLTAWFSARELKQHPNRAARRAGVTLAALLPALLLALIFRP